MEARAAPPAAAEKTEGRDKPILVRRGRTHLAYTGVIMLPTFVTDFSMDTDRPTQTQQSRRTHQASQHSGPDRQTGRPTDRMYVESE